MTSIAVVHAVTWTPEEWRRLESIGDVRYTPGLRSGEEDLLGRIGDAEIVVSATIVPITGLTPHCGMHTDAAYRCLTRTCLDNVEAFLGGHPTNVVSGSMTTARP